MFFETRLSRLLFYCQRLGQSARQFSRSASKDPTLRALVVSLENTSTSSCSRRHIGFVLRPFSACAAAFPAILCVVSSLWKVESPNSWCPQTAWLVLAQANLHHRLPQRLASCARAASCSVGQGVICAGSRSSQVLVVVGPQSLEMVLSCRILLIRGLLPSMNIGSCLCL